MTLKMFRFWLVFALLPMVLAGLGGCGNQPQADGAKDKIAQGKNEHDHSQWWCPEHGVTEEECTRCHPTLVKKYKDKGDWCKKHERPDSQCFICHPEKEAEWAAKYEVKYGKKPPKPDPEEGDSAKN